jgi:hypothetical protein
MFLSENMASRRLAVAIATAISVALTSVLFVGARLVPMEWLQRTVFETTGVWIWDNPFRNLYFFVGLLGGAIAGYLSDPHWQAGGADGFRAGLSAGISIYLLLVVYNVLTALLAGGPVAFYVIAVVPLIYVLPILLAFPLEGGLTGMIVGWFRMT